VKAHRSPLHELFKAFKVKPERMEKIENLRRGPRYELHFKVEIAKNKDKAKKQALANEAEYQVFSDGSGIEGKVGAAATLYWNGIEQLTLRYHLGSATEYGIAEAKLVGELLAAFMLSRPRMRYEQATIGADNTATLYNMRNQKPRGAHYLLDAVHDYMEKAIAIGPIGREIMMVWTPGHVDINGNERADEEAKKAAKEIQARRVHFHPFYVDGYQPANQQHRRNTRRVPRLPSRSGCRP
jgi:ribonuclease HI